MQDRHDIHLLKPRDALRYFDQRAIAFNAPITALGAWNRMMAEPLPLLGFAFRIRDAISARFGVKSIGGFSNRTVNNIAVGDHLDFFLVEAVSDTLLVLTERDRHLDVMVCLTIAARTIMITTSVVTHNGFGRAYMIPVAPAHGLIVNAMLRKLACDSIDFRPVM